MKEFAERQFAPTHLNKAAQRHVPAPGDGNSHLPTLQALWKGPNRQQFWDYATAHSLEIITDAPAKAWLVGMTTSGAFDSHLEMIGGMAVEAGQELEIPAEDWKPKRDSMVVSLLKMSWARSTREGFWNLVKERHREIINDPEAVAWLRKMNAAGAFLPADVPPPMLEFMAEPADATAIQEQNPKDVELPTQVIHGTATGPPAPESWKYMFRRDEVDYHWAKRDEEVFIIAETAVNSGTSAYQFMRPSKPDAWTQFYPKPYDFATELKAAICKNMPLLDLGAIICEEGANMLVGELEGLALAGSAEMMGLRALRKTAMKEARERLAREAAGEVLETALPGGGDVYRLQRRVVDDVLQGRIQLSTNVRKGNYGEIKVDVDMVERGWTPLHERVTNIDAPSKRGIDHVFQKKGPPTVQLVVDSKFGYAKLAKLVDGTQQMSEKWIEDRLATVVGDIEFNRIISEGYQSILAKVNASGEISYKLLNEAGDVVGKFTP